MKPRIRFKGFEGKWEETTLLDIAKVRRGLTYSPTNISKTGVRVLRSCNINDDAFELFANDVFVEKSCVNIPLARNGDILITAANGSPRLVGKHCLISYNKSLDFVHGGFMLLASSEEPSFLNASMSSPWYSKFIQIAVHGGNGAIGNLNIDDLNNAQFYMPCQIEERQAIGNFFASLDSQINASTKKIDTLKRVKTASLQSMFPQDGETKPRVRFKGFEGEWKETTLSGNAVFSKGRGYSKSDIEKEGTPLLLYGSLYTDYNTNIIECCTHTKEKENSVKSEGNEVVVPASGETSEDIARASAIKVKGIILGGDLNIITPDRNLEASFLALEISYGKSHKQIVKKAQGKSVVHLHNSDIESTTFYVPQVEEQQAIGNYFTSLDRKISLETQKLEKLKQIKSACLDGMFV